MGYQSRRPGWFFDEHIQGRPGYLPRIERFEQGFFIDHAPARDADQVHPRFHLAERLPVDHALGVGRQRDVQADEICLGVQLSQGNRLGAAAANFVLRDPWVICDPTHPHGHAGLQYDRADIAATDDTDGLTEQLDPLQLLFDPLPTFHGSIGARHGARQ
jgi:hypothetical protein